jgi:hypothetical protein
MTPLSPNEWLGLYDWLYLAIDAAWLRPYRWQCRQEQGVARARRDLVEPDIDNADIPAASYRPL